MRPTAEEWRVVRTITPHDRPLLVLEHRDAGCAPWMPISDVAKLTKLGENIRHLVTKSTPPVTTELLNTARARAIWSHHGRTVYKAVRLCRVDDLIATLEVRVEQGRDRTGQAARALQRLVKYFDGADADADQEGTKAPSNDAPDLGEVKDSGLTRHAAPLVTIGGVTHLAITHLRMEPERRHCLRLAIEEAGGQLATLYRESGASYDFAPVRLVKKHGDTLLKLCLKRSKAEQTRTPSTWLAERPAVDYAPPKVATPDVVHPPQARAPRVRVPTMDERRERAREIAAMLKEEEVSPKPIAEVEKPRAKEKTAPPPASNVVSLRSADGTDGALEVDKINRRASPPRPVVDRRLIDGVAKPVPPLRAVETPVEQQIRESDHHRIANALTRLQAELDRERNARRHLELMLLEVADKIRDRLGDADQAERASQ